VFSSKKSIISSVTADTLIAILKFGAGALTGSAVMIAEGIHSVLDGGSASLVLLGERLGARPATRRHPFGHGKEVYFWTAVVAMLGFVLGGGFAVIEGVMALRSGQHERVWMNFVVLGGAFAFDGASLFIALRELRRYKRDKKYEGGVLSVVRQSHNPAIFVTVLLDLAALAGLTVAAAGVGLSALTASKVPDAVASIVVGGIMMSVAVLLGAEVRGLVVGEGARTSLLADARRIVSADAHIAAVEKLRSLQLGPDDVLLVVTARFAEGVDARELPEVSHALEALLKQAHPSVQEVLFRFD